MVVGTIAAVCAISAVMLQSEKSQRGITLMSEDPEIELAYINFLAQY